MGGEGCVCCRWNRLRRGPCPYNFSSLGSFGGRATLSGTHASSSQLVELTRFAPGRSRDHPVFTVINPINVPPSFFVNECDGSKRQRDHPPEFKIGYLKCSGWWSLDCRRDQCPIATATIENRPSWYDLIETLPVERNQSRFWTEVRPEIYVATMGKSKEFHLPLYSFYSFTSDEGPQWGLEKTFWGRTQISLRNLFGAW